MYLFSLANEATAAADRQIRLLQWDRDGFALYAKRLERGTFQRPLSEKLQLTDGELMLILRGIQLESVKLRKRFQLNNN